MSIRKREWGKNKEKSGWVVDYRDNTGKRRQKTFSRKKDAEAWFTNAAWQVSKGIHTADSQSITVNVAAQLWLDTCQCNDLEPTTIAAYEQHVRLHINPICGERKLSQLTPPIIERIRDNFLQKLSYPMAKRVLRSFKAILTEAYRRGLIAHNPASPVKMPRRPREKSRTTIPSKAEISAYLTASKQCDEISAYPLACLLVFSGLRASELRGLCWSSIDLAKGTVTVSKRVDAKNNFGAPKSYTSNRTIPLPSVAISALRKWKIACPQSKQGLVFPSVRGKVISNDYITRKLLAPAQIAAGLRAGSKHLYGMRTFRHVAASLWIQQNATPKRIQTLMGHSSIQVTYDTYGHLFEQTKQDQEIANAISKEVI